MKVLKVFYSNGDYGAINFETVHRGASVTDVIENPDNYLPESEESEYQWNLEIKEFEGQVDKEFVNFVRNEMTDYDQSKHECFYMEGETV